MKKTKNKTKMLTNKPVDLGLSILELSKIAMYEFWYDYVKPKCKDKAKLCFMDTDSFIIYIKTEGICPQTARDAGARFDTSNYELDRALPKGKHKKVINLMKEELGGKIIKEFAALRAKTYNYLTDNNNGDKNQKTQKSVT